MKSQKPRILIWDIETAPLKAWIWRTGKQYVNYDQIVKGQSSNIICLSYAWLGEKTVRSLDWGLKAQNSAPMIEAFSHVVESADIVIAHNGDKFDMRHINTQRLVNNQPPISWPTSEDTLKMFRKHFYLPSYRLDHIAKLLTGSGKDTMNFQDWVEIVDNKNPKALAKMIRYNKRDVQKLAEVLKRALPHLTPKASRAAILEKAKPACPSCGNERTVSKGLRYTAAGAKQRRRCAACLHPFNVKVPRYAG